VAIRHLRFVMHVFVLCNTDKGYLVGFIVVQNLTGIATVDLVLITCKF